MIALQFLTSRIGLAILLALSIIGHVWQWVSAHDAAVACIADRAQEIAVATEQGKTQALEEARIAQVSIEAQRMRDDIAMREREAAAAKKESRVRIVYRDGTAKADPAACAPGAERMDRSNAVIRGDN